MKTILHTLGGISASLAISLQAFGQADIAGGTGHIAQPGFYLGWNSSLQSSGFDLQIRHDAARPITFHTGPASGGTTPERMRITPTNGFVGIGLASPQNRLHLHISDTQNSVFSQWTTTLTGSAATDGLRIGISPAGTFPFAWYPFAEINQQEDAPMVFMTRNRERMRIMGSTNYFGTNQNEGFVGIGNVENPLSILHLSNNGSSQTGGWRDWMRFGTFINDETDKMYVGLRSGVDGSIDPPFDAVINWGNNTGSPDDHRSSLRFITTIPDGNGADGEPASLDGQETMRITPEGLVGIGDFSDWPGSANPNGSPTARLDVAPGGVRLRGLPTSTQTRVLVADANGNLSLNSSFSTNGITGADNGLYRNGSEVYLGGSLVETTDIELGDFNISFWGQNSPGASHVMIGNNSLSGFNAKLEVEQNSGVPDEVGLYVKTHGEESTAGRFEGGAFGVIANLEDPNLVEKIAVTGGATGGTGNYNFGGMFYAGLPGVNSTSYQNMGLTSGGYGGTFTFGGNFTARKRGEGGTTYGVRADAIAESASGSQVTTNFGVHARAISHTSSSANVNYGVYALAQSYISTGTDYGIYATVGNNQFNTAPTTTAPSYAGYFAGDLAHTGTITFVSDQNLKRQVNTLDSALYILNQLNPVSFRFKRNQYPQMNLARGKQFGLIAQEVQQVLPALVQNNVHPAVVDSAGNIITAAVNYKSVNYTEIIPYLIKGMQEQQAQIDSLQARLAILTAPTGGTRLSSAQNTTVVELSNKAIVLDQNVPNPFAERTSIRFVLPDTYSSALMLFHDMNGRLVKSVQLTDKGEGQLDVYAQNLTDGVYTYTLVVDGTVIDSKRMVRQK